MRNKLITDPTEINALYNFIKDQNLSYPEYDEWAKKCYSELQLGYKKAFAITVNYEGKPKIVGSIIFQEHKFDSSILEIKNARVDPEYRNNNNFKKIFLQVEKYARENGYKKLMGDAHSNETQVISLFQKIGFTIESKENIYDDKHLDIILSKDLSLTRIEQLESIIITSMNKTKNIIKLAIEKVVAILLVKKN